MLRSKFSKSSGGKFRAVKVFTDRDEPRRIFADSASTFLNGQKKSEILIYYGVGGIGKTKLLKELHGNVASLCGLHKKDEPASVYLSLEAYDYSNPVNVLMSIRSQLNMDCGLFDYALLQYGAKTRHTVEDITRKIAGFNGPLLDIMNELLTLGLGSASVPANVLRKSAEIVKDIYVRKKFKDEIETISELSEFEIYQRLPYYLGVCISQAANKGRKHIFFLDSYESLLLRTTDTALVEDSEEWLKELFLSSENVLFVIACREKFKWYEDDPEWNDYLNQHILEHLVYEDSMYFLNQVPINDESVKRAIAELAQGVPLYLDMCVDIYEDAVNSGGVVDENLFNITGNKIIGRYIRHLEDKEKVAVKALAVAGFFSMEFAAYLLQSENIYFSDEELVSFFDRSIFVEIDEQQELLKVDESVRQHVLASMETEKKQSVLENMICYVKNKLKTQPDVAYQYFEQVFRLIVKDTSHFKRCMDDMVKIMYMLMDMGYWCEIQNLAQPHMDSEDTGIRSYCLFAGLFYLRRTSRLDRAQNIIDRNDIVPDALGNYRYLYEFLKTHILHLSGKYDKALIQYRKLAEQTGLVRENIDAHLFYTINTKHIDLLFLKGQFRTALKMVDELADSNTLSLVDRVEIMRVRGHIYRFNFMLREAAMIYNSALELIAREKCASLEGKLYNNLAETYCYSDPKLALEYAAKSMDINGRIDSRIELGKTYAAAGIACSFLSRPGEAAEYARMSVEMQKATGYVSGELFGEISLFTAGYNCNENRYAAELQAAFQRISELIESINVYPFLKLPIYLMLGDTSQMKEAENSCEWLDFEKTVEEIRNIFIDRRKQAAL